MTMVVCGSCFDLERATQWVQSLQGFIDRPDGPEHFEVFFRKLQPNWLAPGVPLERLGDVRSPTLVLIGDDDCVTPEHAAAMVRALPAGSQLGVVPGTSHGLPYEKPALVSQLVLGFLRSEQADKMISS